MAGLDGLQSGIFAGPTALGLPLMGLEGVEGLGVVPAPEVPWYCWDTPGFKDCQANLFNKAADIALNQLGLQSGTQEFEDYKLGYVNANLAGCIEACEAQRAAAQTPAPQPQTQTPPAQTYVPATPGITGTTSTPGNMTNQLPSGGAAGGAAGFFSSKFMGLPMYGWLAGGLVFVGVFLYLNSKKSAAAYGAGEDY